MPASHQGGEGAPAGYTYPNIRWRDGSDWPNIFMEPWLLQTRLKEMMEMLRSVMPGFAVAGASTAVATMAGCAFRPVLDSQHPLALLCVAVMLTAWWAGLRRAILSLILGALCAAYFFLPPDNSFAIAGTANYVGLALYFLVALTGTLLIEALRQQRRQVEELVLSQALFLAREQAARANAEEAHRRLAEEQQAARAEATQLLKAVKEELARTKEELQRPWVELHQFTEALAHQQQREALLIQTSSLLEALGH